jgi:hypothetical protein
MRKLGEGVQEELMSRSKTFYGRDEDNFAATRPRRPLFTERKTGTSLAASSQDTASPLQYRAVGLVGSAHARYQTDRPVIP